MLDEYLKERYRNKKYQDRQHQMERLMVAEQKDKFGDVVEMWVDKNALLKTITSNLALVLIPGGFEYRDNFRYDINEKCIVFDRHRIMKIDGDYEAEDEVGKRILLNNIQQFDSLAYFDEVIDKQCEICNVKNSEYLIDVPALEDIDVNSNEEIIDAKITITKMENYSFYHRLIVRWLNKLNNLIHDNGDSMARQFNKELGVIKRVFFSNDEENAKKELSIFKILFVNVLEIYHPCGYEFGKWIMAVDMENSFNLAYRNINGMMKTGDIVDQDYSYDGKEKR